MRHKKSILGVILAAVLGMILCTPTVLASEPDTVKPMSPPITAIVEESSSSVPSTTPASPRTPNSQVQPEAQADKARSKADTHANSSCIEKLKSYARSDRGIVVKMNLSNLPASKCPAKVLERIEYWSSVWGMSPNKPVSIAACETRLGLYMKNPRAYQVFQQYRTDWQEHYKKFNQLSGFSVGMDPTNMEYNIMVSTWMISEPKGTPYGPWKWECKSANRAVQM